MSTIYGIYGEAMGIHVFKYFFFQSVIATTVAQIMIGSLGTNYSLMLIIMTMISAIGYVLADMADFQFSRTEETLEDLENK